MLSAADEEAVPCQESHRVPLRFVAHHVMAWEISNRTLDVPDVMVLVLSTDDE